MNEFEKVTGKSREILENEKIKVQCSTATP
jgi:hypothetical protein